MNRVHVLAAILACAVGGCVEREMTITSEPSGALVYISDVEVGRTPLTRTFTWYGDYDIILRQEGWQTLTTHAHLNAPLHQLPPFDLFTEIAPWTLHDRRYLHFPMAKLQPPSDEELVRRAEELARRNAEPVEH